MTEPHRAALHGRRGRADVRQALLKYGFEHLYPGIPPGEWRPAGVMADMVLGLRSATHASPRSRERALDEEHFEFRGRLSAAAHDEQRRSRLEDRRDRRGASPHQ
jgi:hypothetical protein